MNAFLPDENTMVCMYGPPEYFEDLSTAQEQPTEQPARQSFFERIAEMFQKLISFIKGLFGAN